MRRRDSNTEPAAGGRRAIALRGVQLALLGLVVVLAGLRFGDRDLRGDGSAIVFGVMAASSLSIGVLERYRARAAKGPR